MYFVFVHKKKSDPIERKKVGIFSKITLKFIVQIGFSFIFLLTPFKIFMLYKKESV